MGSLDHHPKPALVLSGCWPHLGVVSSPPSSRCGCGDGDDSGVSSMKSPYRISYAIVKKSRILFQNEIRDDISLDLCFLEVPGFKLGFNMSSVVDFLGEWMLYFRLFNNRGVCPRRPSTQHALALACPSFLAPDLILFWSSFVSLNSEI